ncbi:unnamed protein product [Aphis gossypii]|uniref:Uncharacterized protein n=1 Tax=Aphis gossypii TaxID=80765 RepID=A0A9P0IW57_APHGO|nr:unnamed protein product [Aphis gossypii]
MTTRINLQRTGNRSVQRVTIILLPTYIRADLRVDYVAVGRTSDRKCQMLLDKNNEKTSLAIIVYIARRRTECETVAIIISRLQIAKVASNDVGVARSPRYKPGSRCDTIDGLYRGRPFGMINDGRTGVCGHDAFESDFTLNIPRERHITAP